jgi:hypothetical protein
MCLEGTTCRNKVCPILKWKKNYAHQIMVPVTSRRSLYTNEIAEKSPQQQFEGNEIMLHLRSLTPKITELQRTNIIRLPRSPPYLPHREAPSK